VKIIIRILNSFSLVHL